MESTIADFQHPNQRSLVRLEHFLDAILRKSLARTLEERDAIYTQASQCAQLRQLFEEMRALSSTHSFVASKRVEGGGGGGGGKTNNDAENSTATFNSNSGVASSRSSASQQKQRNAILVDIGNHFYMQAHVSNSQLVHVNLGCGVILPMSIEDAEVFLVKKENSLRRAAERKTRESLRVRFRIRLVMEAIARLNESVSAVA